MPGGARGGRAVPGRAGPGAAAGARGLGSPLVPVPAPSPWSAPLGPPRRRGGSGQQRPERLAARAGGELSPAANDKISHVFNMKLLSPFPKPRFNSGPSPPGSRRPCPRTRGSSAVPALIVPRPGRGGGGNSAVVPGVLRSYSARGAALRCRSTPGEFRGCALSAVIA